MKRRYRTDNLSVYINFSEVLFVGAFTNADRNVSHLAITFKSINGGISDDGIRQTEDAQADTLNLTVPANLDIAQMYRVIAPSQTVTVTIFDLHYGDDGYLVVWMGQVAECALRINIQHKFTSDIGFNIRAHRAKKTWSRNCPHTLYDNDCQVQRSVYKVEGLIDRLDGASIALQMRRHTRMGTTQAVMWNGRVNMDLSNVVLSHIRAIC